MLVMKRSVSVILHKNPQCINALKDLKILKELIKDISPKKKHLKKKNKYMFINTNK